MAKLKTFSSFFSEEEKILKLNIEISDISVFVKTTMRKPQIMIEDSSFYVKIELMLC